MKRKFCSKCGVPVEEGAVKCRLCGAPIGKQEEISSEHTCAQQEDELQNDGYAQQENEDADGGYVQQVNEPQNNENDQPSVKSAVANSDRIFAVMSYVSFFVIVPILLRPNSRFVRFHVNQGLVLFLIDSFMMIISGMFGGMEIVVSILRVIECLCYALMFFGILTALQGREKALPIIGKIRLLR